MAGSSKSSKKPVSRPVNRPVSRQKNVSSSKPKSTAKRQVNWDADFADPRKNTMGINWGSANPKFDDAFLASARQQKRSGQNYNTYGSGRGLANTRVVKQDDINTGKYRKSKGH